MVSHGKKNYEMSTNIFEGIL